MNVWLANQCLVSISQESGKVFITPTSQSAEGDLIEENIHMPSFVEAAQESEPNTGAQAMVGCPNQHYQPRMC